MPTIDGLYPRRRSRALFHWRGDRFELDAISRVKITGGGEVGAVFSRAATAAPADSAGTTRTVVQHQPAWEIVDWDGDATRDTPAIFLGASDSLSINHGVLPQASTLYLEFVENGTRTIASAAVFYIGNAGNTGARFWIDTTGSFYRVRHHNGSTEVTSTISSGAPTAGQRVAIRATLGSDGKVQIFQSINGAAETSGTLSGTNTLASAWSGTNIYLGSTGSTNKGNAKIVRVRMQAGSLTAVQMQEVW